MRSIARNLYAEVRELPIISPHGHTDAGWFALNEPFRNATSLLVTPDHYLLRMLFSQGVPLQALGVAEKESNRLSIRVRRGARSRGTSTCSTAPHRRYG